MVEEKGTGVFMDEPGLESYEELTAAELDQNLAEPQEFSAEISLDSTIMEEEPEETLPAEFLEDAETFSSVLPRGGLDDEDLGSFNSLETVTMTPSEVRRLAARQFDRGMGSSRRGVASVSGGARRTRKIEEADLSPEELAIRRRNDIRAKVIIYSVVLLSVLVFAALLTYKLPVLLPDYFPDPVWPWNVLLPDSY